MNLRHWNRLGLSLALGLALSAGMSRASVDGPALPKAKAAEFSTAPAIDGQLTDPAWENATPFTLDRVMYKEDQPPSITTEVRLGVDNDYLYVGVRSTFPEGETIRAESSGPNNMNVGRDDHIELFIRPSAHALFPYYHFLVGAGNARREARVVNVKGRDHEWSVAWRTATRVRENVWTAEIAIPLYALGAGRLPDEPLRFSIVNCKMRGSHNQDSEFITWAPVGGKRSNFGFHDPVRFGYLTGLENRTIRPRFAPTILAAANAGLYSVVDGRFTYTVDVTLSNRGGAEGVTDVVCEDRSQAGPPTRTTQSVSVPAQGKTDVSLRIPVLAPGTRTARVILAADEKRPGALWTGVERMDALTAMTAYPNLNVYSGEAEGRFIIGTVYPDAQFRARNLVLALAVTGPDGERVLGKEFSETKNQGVVIPLPISQWKPGVYPVTVELRTPDKTIIAAVTSRLRVALPPPDGIHVSKLDHERMCILKDGKPFFPYSFMSYVYGGGEAVDAFGEEWGEKYAQAGFNMITSWILRNIGRAGKTWTPAQDERLATAVARENTAMEGAYRKHGLFVGTRLEGFLIRPVGRTTPAEHALLTNQLPVVVNGLKTNPGLLMYYGVDEPVPTPELNTQAELVRELDPYHLQYASCCQYVSASLYRAYDLYFIHHYWNPAVGPNGLASLIREGTRTAKLFRVPMVATPQGQRTTYARELLPQERLAGLVLPVINGAKGICFFAPDDQTATHPVTWRVITYAGKMFQTLAPILVNNPPPQTVQATASPAGRLADLPSLPKPRTRFDPSWEGKYIPVNEADMPVIQARIWDLSSKPLSAQGKQANRPRTGAPVDVVRGELILVCNSTPYPVPASVALSSIAGEEGGVQDYFGGKRYPVKDGRFALDFEPYGVRVLETTGSTRRSGTPVALGIAYTQRGTVDKTGPKRKVEGQAKPGGIYSLADDLAQMAVEASPAKPGENLLNNAGFEECTLPQMPDHWMTHFFMRGFIGGDEEAQEGEYSVRVLPTRGYYSLSQVWWNWEPGQTYTFSVWARAEKPGSVLRMLAMDGSGSPANALMHDIPLTVEWKRYAWTFRAPNKTEPTAWRNAGRVGLWSLDPNDRHLTTDIRPSVSGPVWVDAAQLELGDHATGFTRDTYQAPDFDSKWLNDDVLEELERGG